MADQVEASEAIQESSEGGGPDSTSRPEIVVANDTTDTADNAAELVNAAAEPADNNVDSSAPASQPEAPANLQSDTQSDQTLSPSSEKAPVAVAASETKIKKPSNIVIGLCLAVLGVVIVALITLFTPTPTKDQDIPYLLDPLEKQLDAHLRYKKPSSLESKDWRREFVIEQSIWTNEVSKIILGRADAKPIELKRDYLLYLGDSYFKDEPHFAEAKAAYLTANAAPRIPHENTYDLGDDELWRRIGYCDIRLRFYDEAITWLKKAEKLNAEAAKSNPDLSLKATRARILDNLAECYTRMGQPKKGEETVQLRLAEMRQKYIDQCVEVPVLYNMALVKEAQGDLKAAEHFYKLGIKVYAAEDERNHKVVVPESINDTNRGLARLLMSYSHMLRQADRNDEAIAAMYRALCIYDNPPGL